MKVPRQRIARAMTQRMLQGDYSQKDARGLAAYLLSEGRTSELDSLIRDIQADLAENGDVQATINSAHQLDTAATSQLSAHIKKLYPNARRIQLLPVHDSSLIGGVKVNLPGRQLDLSLRAKLNKLKQLTAAGKDG